MYRIFKSLLKKKYDYEKALYRICINFTQDRHQE